ncbi:PIN domain-containing protein [Pseudomonas fluorescens]|uniref:PIN domain-containing protein n=1 Tax=Pseudomonas fluorescens TaxID=294 RepID=UPI003C1DD156
MREAFSEHFVGEPERQQKLWADCIFVLDTNVLLDLYRFSDTAREALFKVMESLGERLWIPYQVAAEYFENRLTVIEAQSKAYAESISGLKIAKEKFNTGSRHPFVSDEVFNQFISSYDPMIKELEDRRKTYLSFVSDDVIKARIGTLLNGRVGEAYSDERLQEVAVDGEKRYLENIPPGFEDGGKMPEATTKKLRLKKFGDLILWKQVIDKAVATNKSVILVTGEKKDDWWLKSNKGLISALPALTKEFMDAVKQDFYLYATDRFLLKANEYLKQSTSDVVVEEVRAINKADAERKDDLDAALFDETLNFAWPESPETVTRVSKKYLNAWRTQKLKDAWSQNEANTSLTAEMALSMQRREYLLELARQLRVKLDGLRMEREEVLELQRSLLSAGISVEDEKFDGCNTQLSKLASMITAGEAELTVLRQYMQMETDRHNRLLSHGGGD